MPPARRSPLARVIGAVVASCLALLVRAGPAAAQDVPGCRDAIVAWAEACDAGADGVAVVGCPAGHAIFAVGPGSLRVDVTRGTGGAFVQAGDIGLSPVGEVASWTDVPRADRDAFDALVACAQERPAALVEAIAPSPAPGPEHGAVAGPRARHPVPAFPWRAALAVVLALAVVSRFGARGLATRAAAPLALGAIVLVVRRLLVEEAYFHQNGQGPLWIAHALGEPSSYGPGYAQMFAWLATRAHDPDGAVFLAQGVLGALVPVAGLAIARGVGAPALVGWAAAAVLALSPLQARLAQGESYFATCGALLALAAATLATCVRSGAPARENVAGIVAAGLFVAQAALVHPVSWLACALVPLVVAVGPGAGRSQLRLAAIATAGVGAVVVVCAALDLWEVVRGSLGAQWLSPREGVGRRAVPIDVVAAAVAGAAGIVLAVRSERQRRIGIAIAALATTWVVAWTGDQLGAAPARVHHAYAWLYAGPALAALAALAREGETLRREGTARSMPVAVGVGVALVLALSWHAATLDAAITLPTDAREAERMRRWREHLPEGAVVAHLERAERQISTLPLHRQHDVRLFVDQPPSDLTAAGRDVFLFRSSVCTTERGRAFCDALERDYELEPLHTETLPAIPSMPGLDYDRDEVEIALYRIRDRRIGSTTDEGSSAGREGR